jgi:putative transposase
MEKVEELDTIWKVPDELWEGIEPIIRDLDPPQHTGRKRTDPRQMLDGIIHRMRSGCQWNQLPKELGDDSTIHRTFQRWEACGLFPRIWAVIQTRCEELGGVDWKWQSADTAMGKARMGGPDWPQPHGPR